MHFQSNVHSETEVPNAVKYTKNFTIYYYYYYHLKTEFVGKTAVASDCIKQLINTGCAK